MDYAYEILPRPFELGGGWRLRLLEDSDEVGGGVFPPMDEFDDAQEALQSAYEDAQREAHAWLNSREKWTLIHMYSNVVAARRLLILRWQI